MSGPLSGPRVRVDPDLCVGTGECVRLAPMAFRIDERRGISVPQPGAQETELDVLEEAAFNCPTRAITVGERRR
jgi:ferredoxin